MTISIIIPVYNTEKYLAECLDSVIAQSFSDWECLLVDDGSTDQSGTICDRYAEADNRFKVFHTANSGVSAARNLGIGKAAGSYLAFIDSDDAVDRDYLSALYRSMVFYDSELAVCGMKLIRHSDIEINIAEGGGFSVCRENSDRFVDLNHKFLLYGPVVKLYRSDIVKDKNVRFPQGIHYGEDLIFNFNYLEHVTNISVIGGAYYNYRIGSSGTLSTSAQSRHFGNNYAQWNIIKTFFERRGIDSRSAGVFLSDRLWGLAYDMVMSERLSMKKIKKIFNARLTNDLRTFSDYTITIPAWLKLIITNRFILSIWFVQKRVHRNCLGLLTTLNSF